jgi:hypothetical protein
MLSETVIEGQAGFPTTCEPPLGNFSTEAFLTRIPDDEIERLKRQIPLERVVKGFGV